MEFLEDPKVSKLDSHEDVKGDHEQRAAQTTTTSESEACDAQDAASEGGRGPRRRTRKRKEKKRPNGAGGAPKEKGKGTRVPEGAGPLVGDGGPESPC